MDINQRKFNIQIEITDLIVEAVQNASARRNQVLDAKDPLWDLFGEETKGIKGGQIPFYRMGYFPSDNFPD